MGDYSQLSAMCLVGYLPSHISNAPSWNNCLVAEWIFGTDKILFLLSFCVVISYYFY